MLRQAIKLPNSYIVEVADIYGQKTRPEGLRLVFATYDAAESYARFYRDIYGEQYKFRVVGLRNIEVLNYFYYLVKFKIYPVTRTTGLIIKYRK